MGVPQTKPMHRFSPTFQGMFTPPRGSRGDLVLGGYLGTTVAMATLLRFLVLKFVGVLQPKPKHGFSPNIPGMFIPRGSRAD